MKQQGEKTFPMNHDFEGFACAVRFPNNATGHPAPFKRNKQLRSPLATARQLGGALEAALGRRFPARPMYRQEAAPPNPTAPRLRTPVNNIECFPPNFEGLVLGCIDADFCKQILVGKPSPRSTQCIPLHRSLISIFSSKIAKNKFAKKSQIFSEKCKL